jgi:hypothetical protein
VDRQTDTDEQTGRQKGKERLRIIGLFVHILVVFCLEFL